MSTQSKRPARDKLAKYLQPATARERKARGLDQPPGRTFGYTRVSSTEQIEGQSLAVQETKLRAWAQMHGRELHQIVQEPGVSGGIPFSERPEGRKLWTELQRGDTLVAFKLDRMFRSARDCLDVVEQFKARGVSLFLLDMNGGADDVSGNGIARLFLTIVSAFAEFERDRIGERIREAKRRQREQGERSGGTARFGWRVEGKGRDAKLVAIPEQQAAIRKMRKLQAQGLSLRQIAAKLAADGTAISHMTVSKALRAREAV